MAMQELNITFKNKKGIKYAAKFSPSRVEGKQVYNFLAKKDGEDEFSHYGYMTEAFVQKIISNRPGSNNKYIESLELIENKIGKKSRQKIVFDLPSEIKEGSFFGEGSMLKKAGFSLTQTFYKTALYPAITIKPNANFKVDVVDDLQIKSRDNVLECNNFIITGLQDGYSNIIDLDIKNSKAGNINIVDSRAIEWPGGEDLYLSITTYSEGSDIEIKNSSFLAQQDKEKMSNLLRRGYIPIIADRDIKIVGSRIDVHDHTNVNEDLSLEGYALISRGSINIGYSSLYFEEDKDLPTILKADGSIDIKDTNLYLYGEANIGGKLKMATLEGAQTKVIAYIRNTKTKSPLQYKSSGHPVELNINHSTIDNGKYSINLEESVFIKNAKISSQNNKEGKPLNFKNCHIEASSLSNVSDLSNAHIGWAQIENFTLNNKNEKNKTSFIFGFALSTDRENTLDNQKAIMKNCNVELGENDNFSTWGNEKDMATFVNCSFSGRFVLQARADYKELFYVLSSKNSIYKNAVINIKSKETEINGSEIKGDIRSSALTLINNSIVSNSDLENVQTIEDSYVSNYNASEKDINLKNFNSDNQSFGVDPLLAANEELKLI